MWEISIYNQIITVGLSLCLGGLLCAIYDFLRALRKAGFNSATAVFITDILFWIISAFLTFIFLLSQTNGEIRGYVLLCELIGFFLFRITVSKILFKILTFMFKKLFIFIELIKKEISKFYLLFEKISLKILNNIFVFLKSIIKSEKNS